MTRTRDVFDAARSALRSGQSGDAHAAASLPARIAAANRVLVSELHRIDEELDHESEIGRSLRPVVQFVMSSRLGAGNEQTYCGRDGWLFYRPDVEYLTGPGFLDPARLARRAADHEEWEAAPQPDPRPAVAAFVDDLRARGITLIVVPTPVKPAIHPDKLARAYGWAGTAVQNPSFGPAIAAFEAAGAMVFDPAPLLGAARDRSGEPQYLATDTHWRPESMEEVASNLAAFMADRVVLPLLADPGYRAEAGTLTAFGDLRTMLNLSPEARAYPAETVRVRRVVQADGSRWRPSRDADVLVLGDSFSNIYALASLGWGEAAGFVEHLSLALRRPVDRIVENDNGSHATRVRLRHELSSGVDRLAGKRVVVYQFSARELAIGDWKIVAVEPEPGR